MRFAVAGAVMAALMGGALPVSAAGGPGSFDQYSYTNASGTRTYNVYVPPSYHGRPMPLIVDLHGCGTSTTASAEEESRWSRFNIVGAKYGFLVAYPEQDAGANGSKCWNWFLPQDQTREPGQPTSPDTGEPSIIAGITHAVMSKWSVDAGHVYVGGISAGGAMSVVMAVTYPDLYAAAYVYAGCEYQGTTCLGSLAALPPSVAGQRAHDAGGKYARVVPVMVVHGDMDEEVPYPNAELTVQSFLHMDAWAADGSDTAALITMPDNTATGAKPGGQSYQVDQWHNQTGCLLAEKFTVHGMLHQWSDAVNTGTPRDTVFTDPAGPDVTTPIYEFFMSHPMPPAGNAGCFQVSGSATLHGLVDTSIPGRSGMPFTAPAPDRPVVPAALLLASGVLLGGILQLRRKMN